MTWNLRWELRRNDLTSAPPVASATAGPNGPAGSNTPITEDELSAIRRHLEEATAGAASEGWVARGAARPPYDRASPQWQALLDALTAVRAAFPGATLQVRDDMGLIGWSAARGRYAFVYQPPDEPAERAGAQPPGAPAQDPEARPALAAAATSPRPAALGPFDELPLEPTSSPPPALAQPAASAATGSDAPAPAEMAVRERLGQLLSSRDGYDLRRELERNHPPELVARLALELLPTLEERGELTFLLRDVLGKVEDLTPLAPRLTGLWELRPGDRRWLRDVTNALESVASHPAALDPALRAVLGEGEADDEVGADPGARERRLEAAARLLGYAATAAETALPALIERARRDRARTARDAAWRAEIVSALRDLRRPEAFATLLLECQAEDPPPWSRLIPAMVRCDPGRLTALAPRLLSLPEVANELAMELGEVRTPEATELLRQLAQHPLPRTRGYAARHLLKRGPGELPLVAAVWASLDAGATPDDISRYDREDAIEALGGDKRARQVDWAALVAGKGLELAALPALPSPLEAATHPDAYVRHRSLRALDDRPRLEHLLAVGLVAEVHNLLHARYPRVDEYSSWYRWGEAAGMPAWLREARDQIPQLIRSHAAELPDQAMTPALQELLERGAEWFISTLPEPILALSVEEMAAADAEERALIGTRRGAARAADPLAEPGLPDVAALFPEPLADMQGPTIGGPEEAQRRRIAPGRDVSPDELLGGADLGRLLQISPETATPPAPRSPLEALRLIRPEQARLLRYPIRDRDVLDLLVLIESRARHLRLDCLEAIVRDAHDTTIAHARRTSDRRIRGAAWLDVQWMFELGALAAAATIELRATWRHAFRARIATLQLPDFTPPPPSAVWQPIPVAVVPHAEAPEIEARASLAVRTDRYVELKFLVELTEQLPVTTATEVKLALAARNKGGSALEHRHTAMILPAGGNSAFEEVTLRLAFAEQPRARWIDFAVQGARTSTETLAVYRLPRGDSACR